MSGVRPLEAPRPLPRRQRRRARLPLPHVTDRPRPGQCGPAQFGQLVCQKYTIPPTAHPSPPAQPPPPRLQGPAAGGAAPAPSAAIHDAIRGSAAQVVEVHLSNVHARESFRHHSYISAVAAGVIVGFGALSYDLALDAILSGELDKKS